MTPTPESVKTLETAADNGLTSLDLKKGKDVLADKNGRTEFLNYLKDAKNKTKLAECVGPSLQNILNDPTADKETKDAAQKLMVDLGLVKPEENKNNTGDKNDNKTETEKKAPNITNENVKNMKVTIDADPKLAQDPQKSEIFTNLEKALKSNDIAAIGLALKDAWNYVKDTFFGKNGLNGKTELGFTDFTKVQEQIRNVLSKKPTKAELESAIKELDALVKYEGNIKKKLGYVYTESRFSDQTAIQDHPEKSTYDLLAGKLHVGDVILLNKEDPGVGGKLLNGLSQSDIDATHTIVITNESPLQFSQATMKKENGGGMGVDYNVDLKAYLQKYPSDAIVMETSPQMKANAKKYIDAKTGESDQKNAQYDYLSAAGSIINPTEAAKANKYNCVQYVAKVLGINNDKQNYTKPNEFLNLSANIMQPSYMTTLFNEQSFKTHDLMDHFTALPPAPATATPEKKTPTPEAPKKVG